jgi:hypothetical protein
LECVEVEGRDHLSDSLQRTMHWSEIFVLLKSDVVGRDHLKYVKALDDWSKRLCIGIALIF